MSTRSFAFAKVTLGLVCAATLVGGASSMSACADTQGAMDDYLARTQPLRNQYLQGESDAAIASDAGAFAGTYMLYCLSPLVAGDVKRTLRFKAVVTYAPVETGTGPISMTLQAMTIGTTSGANAIGPIFPAAPAASAEVTNGKFVLAIGDSPDLPKESNPLTGVDWGINALVFRGTLTTPPAGFCANLTGLTRPSGLDAAGTTCLFKAASSDDESIPVPEAAEYTCPQ